LFAGGEGETVAAGCVLGVVDPEGGGGVFAQVAASGEEGGAEGGDELCVVDPVVLFAEDAADDAGGEGGFEGLGFVAGDPADGEVEALLEGEVVAEGGGVVAVEGGDEGGATSVVEVGVGFFVECFDEGGVSAHGLDAEASEWAFTELGFGGRGEHSGGGAGGFVSGLGAVDEEDAAVGFAQAQGEAEADDPSAEDGDIVHGGCLGMWVVGMRRGGREGR
jgi:hypothetical protein